MPSDSTLVTAPPNSVPHAWTSWIKPQYEPVQDESLMTFSIGGSQKSNIRFLDCTYAIWNALPDNNTVITIERPLAKFFNPLDLVCLRSPRLPSRYRNAAHELRELLPTLSFETIAKMCGVSDTGFRNWLRGKGIREKQLRRLLANRSLVRALVVQRGLASANDWLQKPHPQLDGKPPVEVICDGHIEAVLPLALSWTTPTRRAIIPFIEDADDDAESGESVTDQQLAPIEVYTAF